MTGSIHQEHRHSEYFHATRNGDPWETYSHFFVGEGLIPSLKSAKAGINPASTMAKGRPQPAGGSEWWPRPERQGGWRPAIGHSLATVRHDTRMASETQTKTREFCSALVLQTTTHRTTL